MRIHVLNLRADLKDLMIGNETGKFLKNEVGPVHKAVEDVAGPLAADGGFLGNDIYGSMLELGWDTLDQRSLGVHDRNSTISSIQTTKAQRLK